MPTQKELDEGRYIKDADGKLTKNPNYSKKPESVQTTAPEEVVDQPPLQEPQADTPPEASPAEAAPPEQPKESE